MPPLLQLLSIRKSFGAVQALKGVSFDLLAGEVHALLGENGAGKSTLIKTITGVLQPDSGELHVAGQRVHSLTPAAARKLGIACIYQQPALFPDLSVAENIGLRLEQPSPFKRVRWKARREQAQRLLRAIGAQIDPSLEARQLSMPEQQLVEIACALGAGARIVLMDEPTASLTPQEQTLLFRVVRELRAQGTGVIYISHRLEEIFDLADRVTVLRDGESVGTHSVKAIDEASLIRLMIGRELGLLYPPQTSEAWETVFAAKNLTCNAGGVHDITFELKKGEILGMAGLVGAGRTELARVLFGVTPADAGEMRMNGERIEVRSPAEAVRHGLAYVPEDRRRHGVILEMPIEQNMTMAIHPQIFRGGWLRLAAERRLALDYIQALQIRTPGPDAPGNWLSGGNQQKVSLARWLATKPKLLVLDEPTQGVDVGAKSEIHKLIRDLARQGLAVLMISSDLREVLSMSDRILVMRGGRLVATLPGKSEPHTVMAAALGQAEAAAA